MRPQSGGVSATEAQEADSRTGRSDARLAEGAAQGGAGDARRRSLSSDPALRGGSRAVPIEMSSVHADGGGSSAPRALSGGGGGMSSFERHTTDLTYAVIDLLSPMLPTEEEYRMKEATRRQLERFAARVSPGARLLAFGSMANGFALRHCDMDLCCLVANEGEGGEAAGETRTAAELVEVLGGVLREETDFNVLPLPKARIPIIKISRPPTKDVPCDIACDIGFNNRLALENTRLLLSYAMLDPPRLRTLVLFLKVWTKRRKLNSPFTGTLSSYGYTLMVLFFLIHVKRPAVLPNLQRIPPIRPLRAEDVMLEGHNIYFFDDVETLRRSWASVNAESVGELLLDFFRYFSRDFLYARDALSICTEGGLVPKESRGWLGEQLCIEDPFQVGYNVARTVTKDGLYTIRGEFMRASRLLANRSVRASALLEELVAEREDGLTRAPDQPTSRAGRMHARHGSAKSRSFGRPAGWSHLQDAQRFASGIGGSLAFEEMARNLGNVQGVAYPPTAAMLAPLSQTNALRGGVPGLGPPPVAPVPQAPASVGAADKRASVPPSPELPHAAQLQAASVPTPMLQGAPGGAPPVLAVPAAPVPRSLSDSHRGSGTDAEHLVPGLQVLTLDGVTPVAAPVPPPAEPPLAPRGAPPADEADPPLDASPEAGEPSVFGMSPEAPTAEWRRPQG